MYGVVDLIVLPCTVVLADHHACTGGKTHEKANEGIDDGCNTANGSVCFIADKAPQHPGVDHVVKLLKQIAQ